jgi:CheY-like chemotaxis protein
MTNLYILCIEDEQEVRDTLERDLEPFTSHFEVELAEDADDAASVVAEYIKQGKELALVLCDHILPGKLGVDFLVELNQSPETAPSKKVLVTGQAGLEETICAVNQADLDRYIAKPWTAEELQQVVRQQLTNYVIEWEENPTTYINVLDSERILQSIKDNRRLEE